MSPNRDFKVEKACHRGLRNIPWGSEAIASYVITDHTFKRYINKSIPQDRSIRFHLKADVSIAKQLSAMRLLLIDEDDLGAAIASNQVFRNRKGSRKKKKKKKEKERKTLFKLFHILFFFDTKRTSNRRSKSPWKMRWLSEVSFPFAFFFSLSFSFLAYSLCFFFSSHSSSSSSSPAAVLQAVYSQVQRVLGNLFGSVSKINELRSLVIFIFNLCLNIFTPDWPTSSARLWLSQKSVRRHCVVHQQPARSVWSCLLTGFWWFLFLICCIVWNNSNLFPFFFLKVEKAAVSHKRRKDPGRAGPGSVLTKDQDSWWPTGFFRGAI